MAADKNTRHWACPGAPADAQLQCSEMVASSEPCTFEEGEGDSSLVLIIITEGGGGDGVSDFFLIMTVTPLPSVRRRRDEEGLTPSQFLRTRSPASAARQWIFTNMLCRTDVKSIAIADWKDCFPSAATTCTLFLLHCRVELLCTSDALVPGNRGPPQAGDKCAV